MHESLALRLACPVLLSLSVAGAERRVEAPRQARPEGIVIVVGARTAAEEASGLKAWREALDRDGWASWLVVDAWTGCAPVREVLTQLAAAEPGIVGAVLVGDVPRAVLHDVGHLTARGGSSGAGAEKGVESDLYFADLETVFERRDEPAASASIEHFAPAPLPPVRVRRRLFVARLPADGPLPAAPSRLSAFLERAARAHVAPKPLTQAVALAPIESRASFASWLAHSRDVFPELSLPGGALFHLGVDDASAERAKAARVGRAGEATLFLIRDGLADSDLLPFVLDEPGPPLVVAAEGAYAFDSTSPNAAYLGSNRLLVVADGFRPLSGHAADIGLLALGTSVGACSRRSPFVDTRLFGDPTLTFADGALARASRDPFDERRLDDDAIEGLLQPSSPPVLRALAVAAAAERRGAPFASELVRLLKRDPSPIVRFASLEALARARSDSFVGMLPDTALDPDDAVREAAVQAMGAVGRRDHLRRLIDRFVRDPSPEVARRAERSLSLFDLTLLTSAVDDFAVDCVPGTASEAALAALGTIVEHARRLEGTIATLSDARADPDTLLQALKVLSESPVHRAVPPLLELALREQAPPAARVAALDLLGRYTLSQQRFATREKLTDLAVSTSAPEAVRRAARLAGHRLDTGDAAPFQP